MRKRNKFDFDSYSALLGFSFGFGGFAGMYLVGFSKIYTAAQNYILYSSP